MTYECLMQRCVCVSWRHQTLNFCVFTRMHTIRFCKRTVIESQLMEKFFTTYKVSRGFFLTADLSARPGAFDLRRMLRLNRARFRLRHTYFFFADILPASSKASGRICFLVRESCCVISPSSLVTSCRRNTPEKQKEIPKINLLPAVGTRQSVRPATEHLLSKKGRVCEAFIYQCMGP